MSSAAADIIAEPSTSLVVREGGNGSIAAFASESNFEAAQRIAKALAASTVVPEAYRNSVANCLVAMELAHRTKASPLMVMQNLHIIKGKPSWSSAFLVASINTCGRFSPLRFEAIGEPSRPGWKCRAFASDLATGEVLHGTWVTWDMAVGEGWTSRTDSKWKTMPEQMIRYRSAAFWARIYAPEISLGMHTADEISDLNEPRAVSVGAKSLNDALVDAEASVVVETEVTMLADDLELLRSET